MFGKNWTTSSRRYRVKVLYDVRIPMRDGAALSADIYLPDADGAFPAILGLHCYHQHTQTAPIMPREYVASAYPKPDMDIGNGVLESGDPVFYARRGYVHVICNVRGSGKSDGVYPFLNETESQDGYDVVEWIALQPWCDGNVGMFACSYYGYTQFFTAAANPPHLKCIFPSWSATDQYRDLIYHGGILSYKFVNKWCDTIHNLRYTSQLKTMWGEERYRQELERARNDPELRGIPEIMDALEHPNASPRNALAADIWLSRDAGEFWEKRLVDHSKVTIPMYVGCCWGMYGLHLPAAFRAFQAHKGAKKMFIGPPVYLDRPMYQLQYESLRWFDYWLKGMENGIMDEPPIRLYMRSQGTWKEAEEWPLPETRWTPFLLHENHLLWEREYFPYEGCTSFSDSPYEHGSVSFMTPQFVEETEVVGPSVLELYAATTMDEILWFVSVYEVAADGKEQLLIKGWLRGSHKDTYDEALSEPWLPYYRHDKRTPLVPGEINRFLIPVLPMANVFKMGTCLKVRIGCCDLPAANSMEGTTVGHIKQPYCSRITIFHDAEHPSCFHVPIVRGNLIGTFIGGGHPYLNE